jgi:hypothetical protein
VAGDFSIEMGVGRSGRRTGTYVGHSPAPFEWGRRHFVESRASASL